MRRLACIASAVVVFTTPAIGQTVHLSCAGTMDQYEPQRTEGNASGAAIVDLTQNLITTPVGVFGIFKTTDTSVLFDDRRSQGAESYKVIGQLDRISGRMTIIWRTPQEDAKALAQQPFKMSMYADLKCTVAKRLF